MWFWFAVALAAPPAGLDLDDPAPWEAASSRLLDGPPGCWEVVGKATWNHDGGKFFQSRGAAIFAGRLQDGVWGELHIEPLGEILKEKRHEPEKRVYRDEQLFFPLLGQHADDDDEESTPNNLVREVLKELQGSARYDWVSWDEEREAVVFTEVIPIGKRTDAPEVQVEFLFPGGGVGPTRGDVTFPAKFPVNKVPLVVVRDGVMELRGAVAGGQVFPAAEAYSAELRALGFVFHSAQTIQYRSLRPCPVEAPPEPAPETAPEPRRHHGHERRDIE